MIMRKAHPLFKIINGSLIDLPCPSNISSWWNFGSLLGICLGVQLVTGLFLAMHYKSDVNMAFQAIDHICRDVKNGWILRFFHANGASFFFICLYMHIGRGIYYGSFNFHYTWNVGVILFLITMMTAFVGYVLPWGQMSFWGASKNPHSHPTGFSFFLQSSLVSIKMEFVCLFVFSGTV